MSSFCDNALLETAPNTIFEFSGHIFHILALSAFQKYSTCWVFSVLCLCPEIKYMQTDIESVMLSSETYKRSSGVPHLCLSQFWMRRLSLHTMWSLVMTVCHLFEEAKNLLRTYAPYQQEPNWGDVPGPCTYIYKWSCR